MLTRSILAFGFTAFSLLAFASAAEAKPKGQEMNPNDVVDACYRDSDCHISISDDGNNIGGYTSNGGFGCTRLYDYRQPGGKDFYCSYSSDDDGDDEEDEEESE